MQSAKSAQEGIEKSNGSMKAINMFWYNNRLTDFSLSKFVFTYCTKATRTGSSFFMPARCISKLTVGSVDIRALTWRSIVRGHLHVGGSVTFGM